MRERSHSGSFVKRAETLAPARDTGRLRARRSDQEEKKMSNKLFVGGLSWGTTDEGLRRAFEEYGEVTDAKVILDRDTGRSRGFGFVTYADASDAASAISAMDGSTLDGRNIRVNQANDRPERRGGGGGGRGGFGGGGGGGRGGERRGGRGGGFGGRDDRW